MTELNTRRSDNIPELISRQMIALCSTPQKEGGVFILLFFLYPDEHGGRKEERLGKVARVE